MCHLYGSVLSIIAALSVYLSTTVSDASEIDTLLTEDKAIAAANSYLDRVYQKIITTLDSQITADDEDSRKIKEALIEAERAWIKWRDAEALLRAYAGGAVGAARLTRTYIRP